ncbi:MAG TPA: hypothetical protein VNO32_06080, partial [Candidatus Acidoferrum sp.]|nr:hypothetical protein [Candidatus Acidoferrum sp.]
ADVVHATSSRWIFLSFIDIFDARIRRIALFRSFRFLQGLGERPGPCQYYVSLYAIFLSRR